MSLRSSKRNAEIQDPCHGGCLTDDEIDVNDELEQWLCAECGQDLTTEKTSIGCDFKFCNRWFHPSCLKSIIPPEEEEWFCHLCQSDEISPQNNSSNSRGRPKVDTGQTKCLSCKRKVDNAEFIACNGRCA